MANTITSIIYAREMRVDARGAIKAEAGQVVGRLIVVVA
jgi:hypothetical protein